MKLNPYCSAYQHKKYSASAGCCYHNITVVIIVVILARHSYMQHFCIEVANTRHERFYVTLLVTMQMLFIPYDLYLPAALLNLPRRPLQTVMVNRM